MEQRKLLIFQSLIIFSIVVSVFLIWEFYVIPESQRLSNDFSLDKQYRGTNQLADNVYGSLSEPYALEDTLVQDILNVNGNEITIKSVVSSKKAGTDEPQFYVENIYHVDAVTYKHLDRNNRLFDFLPNTEKKNYSFFHPAVYFDDPMVYKGTETILGLETYVFETVTKDADISHAFAQFYPHVIHTDTTSTFWVEPITGNTVRFEKSWENYLVEDGQKINVVEIGSKRTTPFSEHIAVEVALSEIEMQHFTHVFVPSLIISLILVTGFMWIIWSFLEKSKEQLRINKENEKLKDEFFSMLNHEIRNPLTPITSYTEMLLSEKDGPLTEKQRKKLQIILGKTSDLTNLLSDFGDLKKYDLDQVPLLVTEVDMKEYLENVMETVRPFTGEKNINLKLIIDGTWKIVCDQRRISQVISNLVKNSIDFVPDSKGEIIISAKKDPNGTIISIQDNGIGIAPKYSEVIFEKFQQLTLPEYIKHKGTGLGLAICKGIVEAHKGRIWLDTNFKNGTKISFFIPDT